MPVFRYPDAPQPETAPDMVWWKCQCGQWFRVNDPAIERHMGETGHIAMTGPSAAPVAKTRPPDQLDELRKALVELRRATRSVAFDPRVMTVEQADELFRAEGKADEVLAVAAHPSEPVKGTGFPDGLAFQRVAFSSPVLTAHSPEPTEDREGFYEKLWKDVASLQRGNAQEVIARVERYYREHPEGALVEPAEGKGLREAVRWFAGEMERQLQANDGKSGWEDCGRHWLADQARTNLNEAVRLNYSEKDAIVKAAADAANYCMMIADGFRAQPPKETKG